MKFEKDFNIDSSSRIKIWQWEFHKKVCPKEIQGEYKMSLLWKYFSSPDSRADRAEEKKDLKSEHEIRMLVAAKKVINFSLKYFFNFVLVR